MKDINDKIYESGPKPTKYPGRAHHVRPMFGKEHQSVYPGRT